MNYRQINLLNQLEVNMVELMERVEVLESVRENDLQRIRLLENPPKRKPGRPRKNANTH